MIAPPHLANAASVATLGSMAAWTDEPLADREFPNEEDLVDDDDVLGSIVPCPNCGRGIFEDAPQCPICHEWVTGRSSWRSSPKWYVRGGLWAARALLINWLFWIGLTAVTVALMWMGKR